MLTKFLIHCTYGGAGLATCKSGSPGLRPFFTAVLLWPCPIFFIISAPISIAMRLTTKAAAAATPPPNGEVGGRPRRGLAVMRLCAPTFTLHPSTSFALQRVRLIPETERTR
jgi:hypothetical protein